MPISPVRESAQTRHEIQLPERRRLITWLAGIAIVLLAISLALDVVRFVIFAGERIDRGGTLMAVFDVDEEDSLPTYFSTLLLASIGGLLLAWRRTLGASGRASWGWPLLGVIFLGLGLDEMASLHERLAGPMKRVIDADEGVFAAAWVWPMVVILLVLFVALVPFLRALPRQTLIRFVVAGAVFVLGAAGGEVVAAVYGTTTGEPSQMAIQTIVTVEEGMEMFGALLFLRAILLHRELMLTEAEGREPQPASM